MTSQFHDCHHHSNVVSLDHYRQRRSAPDDDVPRPGPLAAWPATLDDAVEAVAPRPRANTR